MTNHKSDNHSFPEYDENDTPSYRRYAFPLHNGTPWNTPLKWKVYEWTSQSRLEHAAEMVTWLQRFRFCHHIVLTYALRSFTSSDLDALHWRNVTLEKQQEYRNGALARALRNYNRYPEAIQMGNDGEKVSVIASHIDEFMNKWKSWIGNYKDRPKKKGSMYWFAVIEPNPYHIHILTTNTEFIRQIPETIYTPRFNDAGDIDGHDALKVMKTDKTSVDKCWGNGWVDINTFVSDDHKNQTIAYLHKTYGREDADSRFTKFHLPKTMKTTD